MDTTPSSNGTGRARPSQLSPVVARNVNELLETQSRHDAARSIQERFVNRITHGSGTIPFVYSQAILFVGWIGANLRLFGLPAFDPYPFGLLTTIVALEAIFLAIFVLITQNRMAVLDRQRADLDLQVNLLSEHEVTRLLVMVDAIAEKLDIPRDERLDPDDLDDLKKDVSPQQVLDELNKPETGGGDAPPELHGQAHAPQ